MDVLGLPKKNIDEKNLIGSFCFVDSEVFIGYSAQKKTKKLEEHQKSKDNKILGEMLCPKISSRGSFFFLCFFFEFF